MKSLNKKAFKLPFMGKDVFVQLTRMGLGYDKGSFYVEDYNNVEKILDFLSGVLGEEVAFLQTCMLCKTEFQCRECKHNHVCPTKDLPLHCICEDCANKTNSYDQYVERTLP